MPFNNITIITYYKFITRISSKSTIKLITCKSYICLIIFLINKVYIYCINAISIRVIINIYVGLVKLGLSLTAL